ncbi:heterokaryon incompatibility protein-domain-containing protein [Xylaria grammica]|nr:heterokaryon incompatibility protein-domain-containing protein [Xylaria grammica]
MRCADCAELRSDHIYLGGGHLLKESMQALKASAEAGCDLCALFWARVVQRSDRAELDLICRGVTRDGKEIPDPNVWLSGQCYPSRPYHPIGNDSDSRPGNSIWMSLGISNDDFGQVSIFADPGTPAAHRFGETWTTVDRNPRHHIEFAQYWMDHCRTQHKLCSSPFFSSASTSEMPTRVIDVGKSSDKHARLVTTRTAEIQAPYLALSYCWGAGVELATALHDGNLRDFQSCIVEERLPRTHRDMFRLARDLGFRYVWIDALCIIQDNNADWEYESKRMAQVYGNATLTVIAGRAADSSEGFLENRLRPITGPCAIPFYDEEIKQKLGLSEAEMGTLSLSLPRSSRYGPVSDRGWCFQESLLSSRALVFGEEQLWFKCQQLEIHEDGSVRRPISYNIQNPYNRTYASDPDAKPTGVVKLDDREISRRWLIFWYREVLWEYTARKLSNPTDVFAAVSGLAQIAKSKIRSRYLGGLWEVDMVRGLLWQCGRLPREPPPRRRVATLPCPRNDPSMQAQVVPMEVPSWSWAKLQSRVRIGWVGRTEIQYHESNWLVRPKYEGRWTRDTTCHATAVYIKRCELEFFGRPQRVKCPEKKGRRFNVHVVPIQEDGENPAIESNDNNRDLVASNIVGYGSIDLPEEMVPNPWCLPVTKTEGLILARDEQGKFRRLGIMAKILDLEWMMSGREEEVCLV